MKKYNKVTLQIYRELCDIVGKSNNIYGDPVKLEPYSHDEIPDKVFSSMPEVVVKPSSSDDSKC